MRKINKIKMGIIFGSIAGMIDVILMASQKLTWDANLSAFFHWIILGFLIAASNINLKGVWRGLLISVLLLIPIGILVGWQEPVSLIPMLVTSVVLGGLLGYFIDRYGENGDVLK